MSLKIYLWLALGLNGFFFLSKAAFLAWGDYPRRTEETRAKDVLAIVLTIPLMIWIWTLLP